MVEVNPIRYRGYYYDTDTDFYYLQSRYYDPEICRFINADDISYLEPTEFSGTNLYAYCKNDPVNYCDPSGHAWETIFDILSLAASILDVAFNPLDPFAWLGLVGDTVDLIPIITGIGETIRALKMSSKIADGTDNAIDTYRALKKVNTGNGLEVHHIVEKRFAIKLGFSKYGGSMPSIALNKLKHAEYTAKWRGIIEYGSKNIVDEKRILRAAIKVYKDDPYLLGAAIYTITKHMN